MWYVKDEFSNKIYFKSNDVRKSQNFAIHFNRTCKFAGQRIFSFVIDDGASCFFIESKVDINNFTRFNGLSFSNKYVHPLAIKGYNSRHVRYLQLKVALFKKLCKKHHLWSYNGSGRKADGFDF